MVKRSKTSPSHGENWGSSPHGGVKQPQKRLLFFIQMDLDGTPSGLPSSIEEKRSGTRGRERLFRIADADRGIKTAEAEMEKLRKLWEEFRSGKPDGAIRQFLKYLLVGGGATLVEWALFWLLDERLEMHHQWATVAAYTVSTFVNWGLGRLLVFKESKRGAAAEIAGVYLAAAVGLLLNMGIMYLLVDALGWNEMLSKVLATGLVFVWNFLIRRLAIYRKAR